MIGAVPLHAPRANVAGKRLGLFYTYVWFQHHVRQVVSYATGALSLEAPMERQADLVYYVP